MIGFRRCLPSVCPLPCVLGNCNLSRARFKHTHTHTFVTGNHRPTRSFSSDRSKQDGFLGCVCAPNTRCALLQTHTRTHNTPKKGKHPTSNQLDNRESFYTQRQLQLRGSAHFGLPYATPYTHTHTRTQHHGCSRLERAEMGFWLAHCTNSH